MKFLFIILRKFQNPILFKLSNSFPKQVNSLCYCCSHDILTATFNSFLCVNMHLCKLKSGNKKFLTSFLFLHSKERGHQNKSFFSILHYFGKSIFYIRMKKKNFLCKSNRKKGSILTVLNTQIKPYLLPSNSKIYVMEFDDIFFAKKTTQR